MTYLKSGSGKSMCRIISNTNSIFLFPKERSVFLSPVVRITGIVNILDEYRKLRGEQPHVISGFHDKKMLFRRRRLAVTSDSRGTEKNKRCLLHRTLHG